MHSSKQKAGIVLGTMTFGMQLFGEDAAQVLSAAFENGITELDTAHVYNGGKCETLLGELLEPCDRSAFKIATKVNPFATGAMDWETISGQMAQSLQRLRLDKVNILYLHFPNHKTPIAETMQACTKLHEEGKFVILGVSNFPAELVEEMVELGCKHSWVVPRVYEGVYNAFSRTVEETLLPMLRVHGIRFTAYNPLAGGILTGRYDNIRELPIEGRFYQMAGYRNRYWKESYFAGSALLKEACREYNIEMANAALRWLLFHSQLSAETEDAVILGVSKKEHLLKNCASQKDGPLPNAVLQAMDAAWELCRLDAPEYFRYVG